MNIASFFTLIQTIIVLIIVIALANIALKFANKYMTKHNNIIKVVERVSVNNNSVLSVVNICGKYYLMSFTGSDNKILKELDKEEVECIIMDIEKNQSFIINKGFPIMGRINEYFGMRKKVD